MKRSIFCFLFAVIGMAQPPAFEVSKRLTRTTQIGGIARVAHLAAPDGGRYAVSQATGADLPLVRPFQAIHSGSGAALSRDAGRNFQAYEVPGIYQVGAIEWGNKSAGLLYASGDYGSFAVSRDGGESWQVNLGALDPGALPTSFLSDRDPSLALIVDPRNENVVYRRAAAAGESLFASGGIQQWAIEAPVFLPADASLPETALGPYLRPASTDVFALEGTRIFRSQSPGGAWEVSASLPAGRSYRELAFDHAGSGRIFAVADDGAVLRSQDSGETWTQIWEGESVRIYVNPIRPGHIVFLGAQESRVSLDGGASLLAATLPPAGRNRSPLLVAALGEEPYSVEFDLADPDFVYAADRRAMSRDAGRTWLAHAPPRIGRLSCSPVDARNCFAIAPRFANFYVEKFDAEGELVWSSYWGGNDPGNPAAAAVDRNGTLWLAAGRQVARVSPSGELLSTQGFAGQIEAFSFSPGGALYAAWSGGGHFLAELDTASLEPRGGLAALPGSVARLAARDDRVAILIDGVPSTWSPGQAAVSPLPPVSRVTIRDFAWSASGDLLLLADRGSLSIPERNSDVVILAWTGQSYTERAALAGDRNDFGDRLALDVRGDVWVSGTTDSFNFPVTLALHSGPSQTRRRGFLAHVSLAGTGTDVDFSTYTAEAGIPVASTRGVDLLSNRTQRRLNAFGEALEVFESFDTEIFDQSAGNTAAHTRLRPVSFPAPRIRRVERFHDRSGGDWSTGSWIRILSEELADLSAYKPELSSASTPNAWMGATVSLNRVPLPVVGAGPGYLEVSLSGALNPGDNAELSLERNGLRSNAVELGVQSDAYELLPRTDDPERASAFNADGTENSAERPAQPGSQITLFALGARGAAKVEIYGLFDGAQPTSPVSTRSDYLLDLPGFLPGIQYLGYTVPTSDGLANPVKMRLYTGFGTTSTLYVWVGPSR